VHCHRKRVTHDSPNKIQLDARLKPNRESFASGAFPGKMRAVHPKVQGAQKRDSMKISII
jgi:hypothetical protein